MPAMSIEEALRAALDPMVRELLEDYDYHRAELARLKRLVEEGFREAFVAGYAGGYAHGEQGAPLDPDAGWIDRQARRIIPPGTDDRVWRAHIAAAMIARRRTRTREPDALRALRVMYRLHEDQCHEAARADRGHAARRHLTRAEVWDLAARCVEVHEIEIGRVAAQEAVACRCDTSACAVHG